MAFPKSVSCENPLVARDSNLDQDPGGKLRQSGEALKQLEDEMETEEKTWDAEKRVRKKIVAALRRW